MQPFERKYTPEQRDAITSAWLDRGVRPAHRIVTLAAAGELEGTNGRLDAFTVPLATVRGYISDERKRRTGRKVSPLSTVPHRDAIETLRQELLGVAWTEIERVKQEQRRKPKDRVDAEHLRQMTRAVRELAALPGPGEERPPKPGQGGKGERQGAETQGGMAGKLLADHRRSPVYGDTQHSKGDGEGSGTHSETERLNGEASARTGSRESERIGVLGGAGQENT